jgi:hypothetical protein
VIYLVAPQITDAYEDLGDGILLSNLLAVLGKTILTKTPEPKVNMKPKMKIHKLENLKYAFDYMRREDVKMVNIGAEDIIEGNKKIILATLWACICRYSVDTIELDGISGKEGLLLWCQRQTKGYDGTEVKDFHRSWGDGLAFCALLDRFGGNVDYNKMKGASANERLALAFKVAAEDFDIDALLDPEDLTETDRPDEKVILAYLSQWFKTFAERLKGANLVKAIHAAIEVTKRHDEWIKEYDNSSTSSVAWIDSKASGFSGREEGANGFGDNSAKIKETLMNFYEYKKSEKPEWKGTIAKLEGLLAKLHSSQRPNNRDEYGPAVNAQQMHDKWAEMETNENEYENVVRDSYATFLGLEKLQDKFNHKHNKCMNWLQMQIDFFSKGDHGGSTIACEALLDNFKVYQEQIKLQHESVKTLQGYAATEKMAIHRDYSELEQKLKALEAKLVETEEAADKYKRSILANKQEFSKLVILMKPEGWMQNMQSLFATDDRGDTSVAVAVMLEVFKEDFTDQVQEHQMTLTRMRQLVNPEAPQAGVAVKLDELDKMMEDTNSKAKQYEKELNERQHTLAELVDQIKEFNSLCTEFINSVDVLEEELACPLVANSVQEAQALADKFQEETQPAVDAIKQQFKQIHELGMTLHGSEEKEAASAFSQYDLNDLNAKGGSAVKSIMAYQKRLMGEGGFLEVELQKEKLRKEFAEHANKLKEYCHKTETKSKEHLSSISNADIPKLTEVQAYLATTTTEVAEAKKEMALLQPLYNQLEEMGVISNVHTIETPFSVAMMFEALEKLHKDATKDTDAMIALKNHHNEMIVKYNGLADPLRAWTDQQTITMSNVQEGVDGFGDTTDKIKQKYDDFYKYKREQKPTYTKSFAEAKELIQELHGEQRRNNMAVFQPAEHIMLEALEKAWEELEAKEEVYEQAIRSSHQRFTALDQVIARFDIKSEKIQAWAAEQCLTFNKKEYGDSAVAVDSLLDNYSLYEQQMDLFREQAFDGLLTENGMEMHIGHPALTKKAGTLETKLNETTSLAEEYEQTLSLNRAEFEKLKSMIKPEKWLGAQQENFANAKRAETSQEVAHMQSAFKESFTDELPRIENILKMVRDKLNADAPTNAGVAAKLAELEGKVEECKSKAAEHEATLTARAAELAGVVEKVREYNTKATKFVFDCDNLEDELSSKLEPDSLAEAQAIVDRYHNEIVSGVTQAEADLGAVAALGGVLKEVNEEEAKAFDSRFKVPELTEKLAEIKKQSEDYKAGLGGVLAGEKEKEELRKKFGDGANVLKDKCAKSTASVGSLSGSLEDQLEQLMKMCEADKVSNKAALDELSPIAEDLESRGVVNNPYTSETIYSLRAMVEALEKVVEDTADALQRNIAAEKSGGLSPEMYQEIKEVFDHFDADNSGFLDKSEFSTSCTAVGLVLSEEDTLKYLEELDVSGDGLISFDEFIAFMQQQMSASGTSKADVLNAFRALAGPQAAPEPVEGEEAQPAPVAATIKESKITGNFPNEGDTLGDAAYLTENMEVAPPPADQKDKEFVFDPFVEKMFTR